MDQAIFVNRICEEISMKPLRTALLISLLCAGARPGLARDFFIVKTPDGREEMKFNCTLDEKTKANECDIKSTQFVIPDPQTKTQMYLWSRQLSAGNDSVRNLLCKSLRFIDPKVVETMEIVTLLKDGCRDGDSKRLALAYAKMDSLSGKTCIIINREEHARFVRGANDTWVFRAPNINACINSKQYVIKQDSAANCKAVEKTYSYSDSKMVACAEGRFIEVNATLKELSDGHIIVPAQCHYLYLQ